MIEGLVGQVLTPMMESSCNFDLDLLGALGGRGRALVALMTRYYKLRLPIKLLSFLTRGVGFGRLLEAAFTLKIQAIIRSLSEVRRLGMGSHAQRNNLISWDRCIPSHEKFDRIIEVVKAPFRARITFRFKCPAIHQHQYPQYSHPRLERSNDCVKGYTGDLCSFAFTFNYIASGLDSGLKSPSTISHITIPLE